MAQLIIGSQNYGFHGFMVQLRDDQGRTMPGVEAGEMGPKINADNTNIGYVAPDPHTISCSLVAAHAPGTLVSLKCESQDSTCSRGISK